MTTACIIEGDCVEQMEKLPAESIDICVTSPPYDKLRTYGGDLSWRLLKPGGVCCWNVADQSVDGSETLTSFRQAIFFKDVVGLIVHDTMIYEKTAVSAPNNLRYHQCFEYVFIFSKGRPKVFNALHDRKNVFAGQRAFGKNTKREADGSFTPIRRRDAYSEYGMRTNVWKGNTASQERPCQELTHPAMMPQWLAHDLILSFSNVGDTVLDPLAGSGTTGEQAIKLGRGCVLIERNPDYLPLIRQSVSVTPGFL